MMKDDELKGEGDSYDFGARMYNPLIGRFFSPDNPKMSNYTFAANSPITFVDYNGDFRPHYKFQERYPCLTNILKKAIPTLVPANNRIVEMLARYGKIDIGMVLFYLAWKTGPEVTPSKLGPLWGTDLEKIHYGRNTNDYIEFNKKLRKNEYNFGVNGLEINSNLLDLLENADPVDVPAVQFYVIAIILHEAVHNLQGLDCIDDPYQESIYDIYREEGDEFAKKSFENKAATEDKYMFDIKPHPTIPKAKLFSITRDGFISYIRDWYNMAINNNIILPLWELYNLPDATTGANPAVNVQNTSSSGGIEPRVLNPRTDSGDEDNRAPTGP